MNAIDRIAQEEKSSRSIRTLEPPRELQASTQPSASGLGVVPDPSAGLAPVIVCNGASLRWRLQRPDGLYEALKQSGAWDRCIAEANEDSVYRKTIEKGLREYFATANVEELQRKARWL